MVGRAGWAGGTRGDAARRALDLLVSAILGVAVLPVIVVAALGSALALRAWPLFVQQRVGLHGELFRLVKIRTLPPEVPRYADKHQLVHHRIPAFCRFLRATHLDELPQIYLVLWGRMSLVGPRPEMAPLHERLPARFAAERTSVRPGCTGLWQVSEACGELIGSAPELDRFYLQHRTLRLDLWVLGRTLRKMTGVGGLISLDQVPSWALPARAEEVDGVFVIDLTVEDGAARAHAPGPEGHRSLST